MNFDKLMCENTNRYYYTTTAAKSSEKTEERSGSRFRVKKKRKYRKASPAPKSSIPEPTVDVVRHKDSLKNRNAESNRSDKKYDRSEVTKKTKTFIQKIPEPSSAKKDRIPEEKELSVTSLIPKRDLSKPRIVLRIFNGKSQLINELTSIQKSPQAIKVPGSNDRITPTIPTRNTEQETEESPPIIDIPKKRRKHKSKLRVNDLKTNKSRHSGELKYEITEKESINMKIDELELEQLENDRIKLLAILENSDDSEIDVPVYNEEETPDVTGDLLKQHEIQFKPEKEPLSNKKERKKGDIKVKSEILSLKHQRVFVETEPIKTDDHEINEKMEKEQPETIITRSKSIFKSSTKRNKKSMFLSKYILYADKEKNIDEEKKEEFISNTNPSYSFEEKLLLGIKKSTDVFDDLMVVQNVKKTHQIQEFKEFQKMNDDVEHILDALHPNNPIGTRCMSAITFATKCMIPAFRMYVKTHGIVAKIFRVLQDATKDHSLGICTAIVMFVLSQDRLNMDLDRDCLELILNLFQNDTNHGQALYDCGLIDHQLQKTWERVLQLCSEIKSQRAAKYLDIDNITVRQLTMETLLILTTHQAEVSFKDEIRQLGGLDHIVRAVIKCCNQVNSKTDLWSPTLLDYIKKVVPYLNILENVTIQNEKNNVYLLNFGNGILTNTLVSMFKVCNYEMPLYPSNDENDKDSIGAILRECLAANLKVLINLSQDFNQITHGSKIGQKDEVIATTLHIFLKVPEYVPRDEKFDIMFLSIQLLINLVEINVKNRKLVAEAKVTDTSTTKSFAIEALVKMFFQQKKLSKVNEKNTHKILEGKNKQTKNPAKDVPLKEDKQFCEDTFALLFHEAERNMRHTMIASHIAILLGYITMDNKEYLELVVKQLPYDRFATMLTVLDKYLIFMKLSASPGFRGIKSVEIIIKHLTKCEKLQSEASGFPGALTHSA